MTDNPVLDSIGSGVNNLADAAIKKYVPE